MSNVTLDALITALTPKQIKTKIYETLSDLNASTTAWNPGGVARLMIAVFSIVSVRERRWFWATRPGRALAAALAAALLAGTGATFSGLAGFAPLPAWQIVALAAYAIVACLLLNDALKIVLIRRLAPAAAG